jgi:hypothetical protein
VQPDVLAEVQRSAEALRRLVWPMIAERVGGGDLLPVEGVPDDLMRKSLDTIAGVDALQILGDGSGMRAIGSRVQGTKRGLQPFNTFTVRYDLPSQSKTEWQKRREALADPSLGLLYPALTVQAYCEEPGPSGAPFERVLTAAVVHTNDLIRVAQKYEPLALSRKDLSIYERRRDPAWLDFNRVDNKWFLAIPWETLAKDGVRLRRFLTPYPKEAA